MDTKLRNAVHYKARIFSAVLLLFLVASSATGQEKYLLTPLRFKETIEKKPKNVVLIDVRTPSEFDESRINGAINIDVKSDYFSDSIATLDKTKVYFLYCKAGVRSSRAREVMNKAKFPHVFELDGGLDVWLDRQFPVVTEKEKEEANN